MPGFVRSTNSDQWWLTFVGQPDDDAAHEKVLEWLTESVSSRFLDPTESLTNPIKGNLGDFIVYKVFAGDVYPNATLIDAANAWDPLSRISRPDIDIVWMFFGDSEADDWAVLQEVKTSSDPALAVADGLGTDYDKLFGEDLRLTLQTRLVSLKNKLELQDRYDYSRRVNGLGGPSPQASPKLRLQPTLVHEGAHSSSTKMMSIRQVLLGRGWSTTQIVCCSIALGNLDDRLARIARGLP